MEKWKSIFGFCQPNHSFAPVELPSGTQRVSFRVNVRASKIRIRISDIAYISNASIGKVVHGEITQMRQISIDANQKITEEIPYSIQPHDELVVSFYMSKGQKISYFNSFMGKGLAKASYFAGRDACMDTSYPFAEGDEGYTIFGLYGVDLYCMDESRTIACFGDSITNMSYWTDALAQKLMEQQMTGYSILNCGISGNRVLHNTSPNFMLGDLFGQAGINRFEKDVFSFEGVDAVILFMGINDIIHPLDKADQSEIVTADQLLNGLLFMAQMAKKHKVSVIGATILPFGNYEYYTEEANLIRNRVNDCLRASKEFSAVLDFDDWMHDQKDPKQLEKSYDFGDGLHINLAGGKRIADKIIESDVLLQLSNK